jgi:hypothetical protein
MDPAEEIVFLAVDIANNKRVHIEVHASVRPLAPLRAWGPAKYGKMPLVERAKYFYNDKFVGSTVEGTGNLRNRCVEETATKFLGSKNYEKWLVLGTLHQKDSEDQLVREFKKYGVRVFFIRDILKQIKFRGTARNPTGRFIQLLASQLTDEAKANLLIPRG